MDEAELRDRLAQAQGSALLAELLLPALFDVLTTAGLLHPAQQAKILDGLLLILEEQRAALPPNDHALVDHARSRLEALLAPRSSRSR